MRRLQKTVRVRFARCISFAGSASALKRAIAAVNKRLRIPWVGGNKLQHVTCATFERLAVVTWFEARTVDQHIEVLRVVSSGSYPLCAAPRVPLDLAKGRLALRALMTFLLDEISFRALLLVRQQQFRQFAGVAQLHEACLELSGGLQLLHDLRMNHEIGFKGIPINIGKLVREISRDDMIVVDVAAVHKINSIRFITPQ